MEITQSIEKKHLRLPWETDATYCQNQVQLFDMLGCENKQLKEISGSSFSLNFTYKLDSPYYSRRDRAGCEKEFATDKCHHNRLCRDWLTGLPMIKGSAWKNLFRKKFAGNHQNFEAIFGKNDPQTTSTEKHSALQGNVKFHHSFFSADNHCLSTMIINPRVPSKGTGKNPISYEVVKKGMRITLSINCHPKIHNPQLSISLFADLVKTALQVQYDNLGGKGAAGFGSLSFKHLQVFAAPFLRPHHQELVDLAGENNISEESLSIDFPQQVNDEKA